MKVKITLPFHNMGSPLKFKASVIESYSATLCSFSPKRYYSFYKNQKLKIKYNLEID